MSTTESGTPNLDEQRAIRLAKIDALRAAGVDPYPTRYERTFTAADVADAATDVLPGGETDVMARVAGRVMVVRRMGKLTFATLRDGTGVLQLLFSRAVTGDAVFDAFDAVDSGDWVGAEGRVVRTHRGEPSIEVRGFTLLSKALRPMPDKWRGLTDPDTRFRQREVDLLVTEDTRRTFAMRSAIVRALRATLDDLAFVEVETPVLQLQPGGAAARPFRTHHNALDLPMYLRIAPELYLKRLVVGGMERVYELGRQFRNEGIDTRHNPEFTMLEVYQALTDASGMMDLTEKLLAAACEATRVGPIVDTPSGPVDLTPPFRRAEMAELIADATGMVLHPSQPVAELREAAESLELEVQPWWGSGAILAEIYDKRVEHDLAGPVFVTGHPAEISPLAKRRPGDPLLAERFELVVAGREIANGYSELNDPVEQRAAFEAGARRAAEGDEEAQVVDDVFLRALEVGLPPTGGLGVGVDRLVMLLAGQNSIREVILFPTLRPEQT